MISLFPLKFDIFLSPLYFIIETLVHVVGNTGLLCSHAQDHVGCIQIYHKLSKSIAMNKQVLKKIRIPQKRQKYIIKQHTFDPDVPESILIDVDNSKVIMNLINTMIFCSMTLPCVQALRWQISQVWRLGFSLQIEEENSKNQKP